MDTLKAAALPGYLSALGVPLAPLAAGAALNSGDWLVGASYVAARRLAMGGRYAMISFAALSPETILRVVDKFLMQLEEQLAEKKVEALFTQELKEHLAKKGFDPLMGARPMARLIQDTVRRALADELLFGKLLHGGRVTIDVDHAEKIVLRFEDQQAPAKPVAPVT